MTSSSTQVARPPMIKVCRPLTWANRVSEGGLEPFAYVLAELEDLWLEL